MSTTPSSGDNHEEKQPDHRTNWELIRDAAGADEDAREAFAARYLPVVRDYLRARWQDKPCFEDLEDATQEVFLQCFQRGGVLARANPDLGEFSGFLYGVVRRTAQVFEARKKRPRNNLSPGTFHPDQMAIDEESLSNVFDRAWARSLVQDAGILFQSLAARLGQDHLQRVELLRLRFQEDLPIREIAELWGQEPKRVHWAYRRAREEFENAICETLSQRGYPPERLKDECARIFGFLS
jgi:RNA polymerase sigma-70 factor (ECF subfamily)